MIYTATNGIKIDACNCGCHTKGVMMDHMVACCDLSGTKYINADSTLDEPLLLRIVEEMANAHKAYRERVDKQVLHPATGATLVQCEEWKRRFAIQNPKITMYMFIEDKGKDIWLTAEDYAIVDDANTKDYLKSIKAGLPV